MNTAALIGRWQALAVLVALCALCWAQPAGAGEISVYVKSGWFTWDEKLNGSSFVKEKGALHGAGITRRDELSRVSIAEFAEVWGGNLDYDGHDLSGTTKVDSDTTYLGTKEEVALGVKLLAGDGLCFEPFAGAGHRFWIRTRSNEDWNSIYVKAGLTGELRLAGYTLYFKGGALLPVYTRTHVSLGNAGFTDVVTEPRSQLSGFAEGGVRLGGFAVSVEYEGMRFGRSGQVPTRQLNYAPGVVVHNSQAFQPYSESSLVSLKLAYSF
jgi:hypothetical protein